MKRGIRVESSFDNGMDVFTVYKKKGRLTVEEVQESLSEKGVEGFAIIILRVGFDMDDGWTDPTQAEGDACSCYELYEGMDCPVCRKMSTLRQYCPECGMKLQGYKEGE